MLDIYPARTSLALKESDGLLDISLARSHRLGYKHTISDLANSNLFHAAPVQLNHSGFLVSSDNMLVQSSWCTCTNLVRSLQSLIIDSSSYTQI